MTLVAFNEVVSSVLSWSEDQGMQQLTGPLTEAINLGCSEYHQLGSTLPSRTHRGTSAVISTCVQIQIYIVTSCDFVTSIFRGPSFGSQVINW